MYEMSWMAKLLFSLYGCGIQLCAQASNVAVDP